MLHREQSGKHIPRARVVRDLRAGPLRGRSEGSISRRSGNISAVLDVVERYVAVAGSRDRTIFAGRYEGNLRCDAYDEALGVLFEAAARPEFARMDRAGLRRYADRDPTLALLPRRPAPATLDS